MQVCLAYKVLLGLIPLLYYVACNYLVYRVFCEGYPYCVANALCQEGAYANGRLNSACVAIAGLCYSKVKREGELATLHLSLK